MALLFLLLGSNLGDRKSMLGEAERRLSAVLGKTAQESSLYETAAWGFTDQPPFLNQVLVYQTDVPPENILHITQELEQNLGRVRMERWGARVIDIDLLFYGDSIITSADLTIPHPHLHLRRFTLAPLAEVAPDFIHPVLQDTISQLLEACPDALEVKKIE